MSKISIAARLRLSFLAMAVFFLSFGLMVLHRMALMDEEANAIEVNWLPSIIATGAINTATSDYRIAKAMHMLAEDPAEMGHWETEITRLERDIAAWRTKYEPLIASETERSVYQEFTRDYETYLAASRASIEKSRQGEKSAALQELKTGHALFLHFSSDLERIIALNQSGADEAIHANNRLYHRSRTLMIIVAGIVVLAALAFMTYFERAISRPLAGLTLAIRRLAEGDLSGEPAGLQRADEIGQIARAVAAITGAIRTLTGDLRTLIEAARAGALSARADQGAHRGDYALLLSGINDLIEALGRPLGEVAGVMQKLAAGDLGGRISGAYEGELRALKANVNRSLDALVGLLRELGGTADGLAHADLTRSVTGTYQGEFAAIKADTNQALADLRELIGALAAGTEQVAVAATETSAAAQQVANGSNQQLMTLNDVSAAVAQTAGAIAEVSTHAERGSGLARSSAESAEAGQSELARLIELVETIAAGYARMQQITAKITRIADKTHVLSLNAGIEAARAGDRGLGFGIVAEQIGRLAEDAAVAARDIEILITDAVQSTQRGAAAAAAARSAVARIVVTARESDRAAQGIAAAITEQSAAVQVLAQRVTDLRGAGEGNAGAAAQIGATMEELSRMVHTIETRVRRFALA